MRLKPRIVDALRHPARLAGLLRRVVQLAFAGKLETMLRRFRPRSATPDEYRDWLADVPPFVPAGTTRFVVLLDAQAVRAQDALRAGLADAAAQAVDVLVRDASGWTRATGDAARPLDALLAPAGEAWLLWIVAPAQVAPDALARLGAGCALPGARVVFADDDVVDADGRPAVPSFRSAWDPWRALEQDDLGPVLAVHRSLAAAVDRARGAAGRWRFLLETAAQHGDDAIVHVPGIVAHVAARAVPSAEVRSAAASAVVAAARSRGLDVAVDPAARPWLRYGEPAPARVSVVVPTRDRPALLERCLASIAQTRGDRDVEVVVVDNGSTDPGVGAVLGTSRDLRVRVVRRPEPFNFPRLCNAGVQAAAGDIVVLLNNDTVVAPGALDELAALAGQPGVGAVGPLLLYPDGLVQSAAVLLGVNRTATSALAGFAPDDPAVAAWCASRRRVTAVLGACIAIRRSTYVEAGGMDERFAVSHNEVDLGLRLQARGLANLFTPFARVVHMEGATRGFEVTADERARLDDEERLFLDTWGALLGHCDPAYHPALAHEGHPFALGRASYRAEPRTGWSRPTGRMPPDRAAAASR
ncbi:MAG TPA: glycosyltransferase [Casimicrobiaceae bacterium]|nr:glycosyltransferase [Casimicrobiaceae bacterium]